MSHYQPYTLPRLPRLRCPYECMEIYRDKNTCYVRSCACNEPVEDKKTGWCKEHSYVLELLEAAVLAGCPGLVVASVYDPTEKKMMPVLFVGADLASWEAYAVRHTEAHHENVMKQLSEIRVKRERIDRDALRKSVATTRRDNAPISAPERAHVA